MRDVSCSLTELIIDVVRVLSQVLGKLKESCDQARFSTRL